jgi:hypothetical protein
MKKLRIFYEDGTTRLVDKAEVPAIKQVGQVTFLCIRHNLVDMDTCEYIDMAKVKSFRVMDVHNQEAIEAAWVIS